MYIHRSLEKTINKYLPSKEIIAIMGARQCGKTTLLRHISKQIPNAVFLDFEDRELLNLFESDIDIFIKLYVKDNKFLFIDEFQYAKEGGRKLKYIYDKHDTKILISGSSSSDLSIQSVQYLVGRIFMFQLNPVSFEEFLNFKDNQLFKEIYYQKNHSSTIAKRINTYLNEFLCFGGYPRVVTSESDEEKITVLKNIFNTYLLKEIKQILNLTTDYKLSKLISALAMQLGGIINYNEISTTTGFAFRDLMAHLNILHKTFITLESKPFYVNKRTEMVKSPKIFFLDNGFRNMALNNFQHIATRPDAGKLRENFVASELIKKEYPLRYWRTKSKAEVDFIIQRDGKNVPLEVKSKVTQPKMSRSFRSFLEKYEPARAFIASTNLFAKEKFNNTSIEWLPIYQVPTIL